MEAPFYPNLNDAVVYDEIPPESSDFCQEILQDGKKYHFCGYSNCGKIFRFKSEFNRHKVIHNVERYFNCPHANCKKTFKREDALKNHLRIHTGELPFVCEVIGCGQRFPTKAGLRYHVLKHKGEKTYQCSLPGCDKSFLTLAQLKQHETAADYHKKVEQKVTVDTTHAVPEYVVHNHPEFNFDFCKDEKIQTKKKDIYLDDYFAPEAREVGNIQWEIRDQFEDPEEIEDGLQDKYESMVKVILKENNAMKQRLDMCQNLINLMSENADLKQKLTKGPSPNQMELNAVADDQIFSFLDF